MLLLEWILGILAFVFGVKVLYALWCTIALRPNHPYNIRLRRERWQIDHPAAKSHPFKY